MKKYLLTALLGVFGLFTAFVSADSVDNFTSSSEICKISNFNSNNISNNLAFTCDISSISYDEGQYYCISTNDIPYYADDENNYINDPNGCFYSNAWASDTNVYFYSDVDSRIEKTIQGTLYISHSSMTYSSSEGGDSGDSLLPGGTTAFSGIISSLGSAVSEFIPYVAYIGIGLLGAIIGFVAIKRLINRVRAKIFGTFSGGRRR